MMFCGVLVVVRKVCEMFLQCMIGCYGELLLSSLILFVVVVQLMRLFSMRLMCSLGERLQVVVLCRQIGLKLLLVRLERVCLRCIFLMVYGVIGLNLVVLLSMFLLVVLQVEQDEEKRKCEQLVFLVSLVRCNDVLQLIVCVRLVLRLLRGLLESVVRCMMVLKVVMLL